MPGKLTPTAFPTAPFSAGPEVEILTATEDFESRSDFEGEEKLRGPTPVDLFGVSGAPQKNKGFLHWEVLKTTWSPNQPIETNQFTIYS